MRVRESIRKLAAGNVGVKAFRTSTATKHQAITEFREQITSGTTRWHEKSILVWVSGNRMYNAFTSQWICPCAGDKKMGWPTGLEPATSRTTIWGSTIEL